MKRMLKRTRSDSQAIATLARVESHLADLRRRAIWRGDEEGFEAFDGAMETIRQLSRRLRFEQAATARAHRETGGAERLPRELAA